MKTEELKFYVCKKCGQLTKYHEEDTYWDEHNCGYSVKLIKCDHCHCDNILKYEEDEWLKNR